MPPHGTTEATRAGDEGDPVVLAVAAGERRIGWVAERYRATDGQGTGPELT